MWCILRKICESRIILNHSHVLLFQLLKPAAHLISLTLRNELLYTQCHKLIISERGDPASLPLWYVNDQFSTFPDSWKVVKATLSISHMYSHNNLLTPIKETLSRNNSGSAIKNGGKNITKDSIFITQSSSSMEEDPILPADTKGWGATIGDWITIFAAEVFDWRVTSN